MSHARDPAILNRLRRADGHLSTVVRMVEEGRDALAIAQQMQAVIKALQKTKHLLILDHIDHHLEDAAGSLTAAGRETLGALREITRYL